MKKNRLLLIIFTALLLMAVLFTGCGSILVAKNGETETGEKVTRQYEFTDFTGIDIGSTFHFEIQESDEYSISITAYESMLDEINVEKDGQTLVISVDFPGIPWSFINVRSSPRIVITMPRLKALDCHGATSGMVTGFDVTDSVDIEVSGASDLNLSGMKAETMKVDVSGASSVMLDTEAQDIDLKMSGASDISGAVIADTISFKVSGASSVTLRGSAGDMSAEISDASDFDVRDLVTGNIGITASGASDCDINVTGVLDADLSGASTVKYYGNPELGDIDVSESSDLIRK